MKNIVASLDKISKEVKNPKLEKEILLVANKIKADTKKELADIKKNLENQYTFIKNTTDSLLKEMDQAIKSGDEGKMETLIKEIKKYQLEKNIKNLAKSIGKAGVIF